MKVRDIISQYLESIGADGLCSPENECGCSRRDLVPCSGCDIENCVPAVREIAKEPGEFHEIGDEIFVKMKGQG